MVTSCEPRVDLDPEPTEAVLNSTPLTRRAAFLLALAVYVGTAGVSRAATPAPAPGQPPRPGPIDRRYTEYSRVATPVFGLDGPRLMAYADSVLQDASRRRDMVGDAAGRYWLGRLLTRSSKVAEAKPYLDSAAVVARAVRDTCMLARVFASRGHGAQITGHPDRAQKFFKETVRLTRATQMGSLEGFAHRGLGMDAKLAGHYDVALRELTLVLKLVGFQTFEHLHSRLLIGEVLNRLGRHEEALVRLDSVLTEAHRRRDQWITAAALHDLGNITFEQGDMASADRNWEYAAAVYDSVQEPASAISARINRATALVYLDRKEEARALLERLVEQGAALEDKAHGIAALGQLGRLHRRMGRTEQAERTLRRVRLESAKIDVAEHDFATLELAGLLSETGRAAQTETLLDSMVAPSRTADITLDHRAAVWFERSVARRALGRNAEALVAARQAERLSRRPSGVSIYWLEDAIEVGRCQRALGRPDSAVAMLARAARVWERWRASISDLEWRERMASGLSSLFAEYGLALLDERRATPQRVRVRQAFDALQAFQARTLEERMHGQGLSARAMAGRIGADSLRRSVLREGELLVDMVATPDTTFVFLLSRRGIEARLMSGTRRLDRLFEDWRQATLAGAEPAVVEAGLRRLSAELLGPIAAPLRASRRVILTGGGSLMLWPIGALTLPGDAAPLGESREIVSAPSATLFAILRQRSAPRPGAPRLLAVGRTTNAGGTALPGAERELRMLGSQYSGVTVRQSRGDRTMSQLTSDLPTWDALHFAAHSEADGGSPWRSGFLLGRDADADAYFRASTVAGLKLRARVAVLSGCQSAGAATLAGEGALGLSAGFLCAGATSVVATLWPVTDRTAERFVATFYAALASGRPVAAAAREARLALRSRIETSNPRDWAAFVVLGEPGTRLPLKRRAAFGRLGGG